MVQPSVFGILWNLAIYVGPMLGRGRQIILYFHLRLKHPWNRNYWMRTKCTWFSLIFKILKNLEVLKLYVTYTFPCESAYKTGPCSLYITLLFTFKFRNINVQLIQFNFFNLGKIFHLYSIFMPPDRMIGGILFLSCLFVCLSVCLSVVNFDLE